MVTQIEDEDLIEELKGFINELIAVVDSTSFRRSSLSESDLATPQQKDFSYKFKEYENQIHKLNTAFEEASKKAHYLESKCESYFTENSKLRDEVARLTIFFSEVKDENLQQMREREQQLKSRFEIERTDLEATIKTLKIQVTDLQDSNNDFKKQVNIFETKIKDQTVIINRIGEDFEPKANFNKLLEEKQIFEQKMFQLENSLLTETSQNETYKSQIHKLRTSLEELNQSKSLLQREFDELNSKLHQQITINKEQISRSDVRNPDQFNFSYKFPQIDESRLDALVFNGGQVDHNQELMSKLEQLQTKFEEHRQQSQRETEALKKQNGDLNNQLLKIRSQHQTLSDEKLAYQRSTRDISTKDYSSIKKSTNDISDELVEKLMRMEHGNKRLRTELKVVNQQLTRNVELHYENLETLYSVTLAYLQHS